MKIITENSTCSNEFAKKIKDVIGDSVSVEYFDDNDISNTNIAILLCSLGCSYDAQTVDASLVSDFVTKWINYTQMLVQKIKENNIPKIYLLINQEQDNLINNTVAKIIKDIFVQLKNECSIDEIDTNIELMLNSNYAQMRFGYTERFTKANVDKITVICDLINTQNSMNHCGVVYSTSI